MLYLLITWFQDSQAKSLKAQDNFATVNAEKSGEGKEKGGEKNYLFTVGFSLWLFFFLPYKVTVIENGLGSGFMRCEITQQHLKIKQQTFDLFMLTSLLKAYGSNWQNRRL